jgi:hypothetical protein
LVSRSRLPNQLSQLYQVKARQGKTTRTIRVRKKNDQDVQCSAKAFSFASKKRPIYIALKKAKTQIIYKLQISCKSKKSLLHFIFSKRVARPDPIKGPK